MKRHFLLRNLSVLNCIQAASAGESCASSQITMLRQLDGLTVGRHIAMLPYYLPFLDQAFLPESLGAKPRRK